MKNHNVLRGRYLVSMFFVFCMAITTLSVFCQNADITISNKKSKKDTDQDWTRIVADSCASINSDLSTITATTSQDKVEQILQNALDKIERVKQLTKRQGVVVDKFTLKLSTPPTVMIDFKFSDDVKAVDASTVR